LNFALFAPNRAAVAHASRTLKIVPIIAQISDTVQQDRSLARRYRLLEREESVSESGLSARLIQRFGDQDGDQGHPAR
jgi:hypothetical protein